MYVKHKTGCKIIQPKSEHLKYWLFYYYRIKRQFNVCASEVSVGNCWIADFAVVKKNEIIEIEIKTSIADLKNDFKNKKSKFMLLESCLKGEEVNYNYIPNYFYYCVPEKIAIKAYEILKDTPYGLIIIPNHHYADHDFFYPRKGSERFNKSYPIELEKRIITRMASEILGLRAKILKLKGEFEVESDKHLWYSLERMESFEHKGYA